MALTQYQMPWGDIATYKGYNCTEDNGWPVWGTNPTHTSEPTESEWIAWYAEYAEYLRQKAIGQRADEVLYYRVSKSEVDYYQFRYNQLAHQRFGHVTPTTLLSVSILSAAGPNGAQFALNTADNNEKVAMENGIFEFVKRVFNERKRLVDSVGQNPKFTANDWNLANTQYPS